MKSKFGTQNCSCLRSVSGGEDREVGKFLGLIYGRDRGFRLKPDADSEKLPTRQLCACRKGTLLRVRRCHHASREVLCYDLKAVVLGSLPGLWCTAVRFDEESGTAGKMGLKLGEAGQHLTPRAEPASGPNSDTVLR
jgi:hypothetical protein